MIIEGFVYAFTVAVVVGKVESWRRAPLLFFSKPKTFALEFHIGLRCSFAAAEERGLAVALSLVEVIVAVLEDD